jgi:uncharacterized protein (DUF58 family)
MTPVRLRLPTVCREGWYYVVVMAFMLGGALMRQINLLMILFGMMAGPLVFNAWYVTRMLYVVRVKRRLPDVVAAGDPLVVELEAECTRKRSSVMALVVEDRAERVAASGSPADEPAVPTAVLFTHIPGGESRRATYRGTLNRRGRYRFGPLKVSTRFPLGLVSRSATMNEETPQELIVVPRLGTLTKRWTHVREEAYQRTRAQQRRQGPLEGEFHNLRPWRSGDSRRWVHWRTSARRGELMVRQFEQHQQRDLAILCELWQPEKPSPDELDSVELAVSFAASVTAELCRRGGCQVVLGIAAREQTLFEGAASQALLQDSLRRLGLAEACPEDGLPKLLVAARDMVPTATHIVLVSTRRVDLQHGERFAEVRRDPRGRALLQHVLTIDASSGDISRYFQPQ